MNAILERPIPLKTKTATLHVARNALCWWGAIVYAGMYLSILIIIS